MEGRAFLATRTEKGKGKEMPVNKGRVRLLVAALRSGEYKKTHGRLHRTEPNGWCCLGVASDVAHKFGLWVDRAAVEFSQCESFDGDVSYMPRSVMEWYGFDSNNPLLRRPDGRTLAASTLNDSGYVPEGESEYTDVSLNDIGRFFKDTYLKK